MDPGILFPIYLVFWIVFAIGTKLLFRKKPAEFKRKYNPVLSGFHLVVFLTFACLAFPRIETFLIFVPAGVALFFVGWKGDRYCDSCGKELGNKFMSGEVRKATFCSQCGAKLKDKP